MNEKMKGLNSTINVANSILAGLLFSIGHFYGMVFNALGFLVLLFPILSFLKYLKNSKSENVNKSSKPKESMEEFDSRILGFFFREIFPFIAPLFLFFTLRVENPSTAFFMASGFTIFAIYYKMHNALFVQNKNIFTGILRLSGYFTLGILFIVVIFSSIFFVFDKQDPASEDSEVSISWRKDSPDFKHSFPKQTLDGSK